MKPTLIEIDSETKNLSEWCRAYDMPYLVVLKRLRRGWDIKTALTTRDRAFNPALVQKRAEKDMIGQRFGRLVVVASAGVNKVEKRVWRCKCDCGGTNVVPTGQLRNGATKSCGCLKEERKAKGNPKHGERWSRAYQAWCNMKGRCDNPALPQYKDWGGRGITYDPRWAGFENFYADMGDPPPGMTLDREDNDGPYCKENCRWAPTHTQRRNCREINDKGGWQLRLVTINDRMQCLQDWLQEYGIRYQSVLKRMEKGMSLVDAITSPKRNWNGM